MAMVVSLAPPACFSRGLNYHTVFINPLKMDILQSFVIHLFHWSEERIKYFRATLWRESSHLPSFKSYYFLVIKC